MNGSTSSSNPSQATDPLRRMVLERALLAACVFATLHVVFPRQALRFFSSVARLCAGVRDAQAFAGK